MTRRARQWLVLLATLAVLGGVLFQVQRGMQEQGQRPMPPRTGAPQGPDGGAPPGPDAAAARAPDVTVVGVRPGRYQAEVRGYGVARAHYQLALTAQVSGQVLELSGSFDSGRRVDRDNLLLRLEDSGYRAAVAAAELTLAEARVALLEEERQGVRARAEWAASGLKGRPDSELVLRAPQLAAARAEVANAEAALDSARRDLARTHILAPFDTLVVERLVAPGSYVQAGTQVATLYSADRVEIAVPLPARDWANLPDAATLTRGDWPAELIGVEGGRRWSGRVLRVERHLDETTRQRALVVALDRPLEATPPLLPGSFLEVRVAGRALDGLWRLPGSALSQRGEVWYVGADDTLASFAAEPLFSTAEALYVTPPPALAAATQRILVHPLNGYLQGMAVHPGEAAGHE